MRRRALGAYLLQLVAYIGIGAALAHSISRGDVFSVVALTVAAVGLAVGSVMEAEWR